MLVQIQKNKSTKKYFCSKGSGFVVLPEKRNVIQKIKEQLGKTKIAGIDLTLKFTNKIQKILSRLRKEKMFLNREYFEIWLSLPPRLYGTVKAHRLEKIYLIRTIVLIIGTPVYEISKYVAEIIQPTLNKNYNKI